MTPSSSAIRASRSTGSPCPISSCSKRSTGYSPDSEEPFFVEIALISSHAPWVPVPELIDWDELWGRHGLQRWGAFGRSTLGGLAGPGSGP